tara:strand:- start:334 stop:525 length:192 start_codon:yes stop_codon:yes gene_type:complete
MELIDMLITGHHRLTADEHHAAAKARRKRIAKGKEALKIRQSMAASLGRHFNQTQMERGTVWE